LISARSNAEHLSDRLLSLPRFVTLGLTLGKLTFQICNAPPVIR
jgi:hypothetical protein